jgi:hypothetical protein
VAQGIAAAGAEVAAHDVGAQPHAARFALHVNALHGATGQILHRLFSCGRDQKWREIRLRGLDQAVGADSAMSTLWCQEKSIQ